MAEVILSATHSHRGSRGAEEDEESLTWAAIERLPTYDRLRTGIIKSFVESECRVVDREVDVLKLHIAERQNFIDSILEVAEEDNEKFLKKLRRRIDRVGIKLPTVEVRFDNLTVEANCYIGTRALPTLSNVARNISESALGLIGIQTAKKTNLKILKGVSGIIKPSRMTLLLGPPSSGKTTLLLALAGNLDSSLKVRGDVTYNGYRLNEFIPQKTSAYISQFDNHEKMMTVQETLDFSARCQGVGTRYELLSELARRERDAGIHPEAEIDLYMKATSMGGVAGSLITNYTLRILGLDMCKDTIVGDQMQIGISGGQKKRVTTGEMIVGPTKTLFMDEISTGLDSSTTYQIVKCMKQIVHNTDATILMSLLQPAPETFVLFDDIILLSEGQIVYQGPRENILEFFESCGFRCPERKGTADFLQEVTSRKDQEQYWADRSKPYRYISVKEFANRFGSFHVGMRLGNELSIPFDKSQGHKAALVFTRYSIAKLELLRACWDKERLLIKRNSFVYIFRAVQISISALIFSTVFLRTQMHTRNEDDGAIYLRSLTYSLVVNTFIGVTELAMTIERLPVFYKHRDLLFHPAWTYTLPTVLLRIPISIFESTIWMVITYFTIGYALEAKRFFKQLLVIFLVEESFAAMFRLIAGVSRTMVIANTGGSLILIMIFLLGGFILPRGKIPNWWAWGSWISPMTYSFNAISVNEMFAPRWMDKLASDNVTRLGVAVLENFGVSPEKNWFWIGCAALLGFSVLFNVLFTLVLMYLTPAKKVHAIITEAVSEEIKGDQQESKEELTLRRPNKNKDLLGQSLSSFDATNSGEMEILQMRYHASGNADSSLEATNNVAPMRGLGLPFTPLGISFDNVNYYVDIPLEMKEDGITDDRLQLLCEVSGALRPGVLTALMGISGAGKTTLMDVLAGRKTGGYIEGDIRVPGFPKKQETFARISGYCEQTGIHSPHVTVKESLIYSAFLRLPKEVSAHDKMVFVKEVMVLVELYSLKDVIVGLPEITGLSTEQRKRLTIAVELVSNPSIIFLDEPTSGLDARAAAIVMRTIRNTVDTGRTVVCTIHQPSIDIFEAFDELLLLKRGGQVIYSGPLGRNANNMIEYFEAVPGVPKFKDKYNPATWMLEVSSVGIEVKLGMDYAQHYRSSSLHQRNKALVKQLSTPPLGLKELYFPTQYSQSTWQQFNICLWKQWLTYWRCPDYNLVRLSFTVITALILGSVFWKVGSKRETATDLNIMIGAMYSAVMFVGRTNSGTVQPIVSTERLVFYRERASGMYSALPYALAQVVVEIPFVLVQNTYFTLIVYSMLSFQWTPAKFFWFFFVTFSFLYFTYYGMMTVSITPNLQAAAILAGAFYPIFNLFSGFFILRPRIPKWWVWYYWICPLAWTVYGLIVSQYGDIEDTIKAPGITPDPTVKWYLEHHYKFDPNFIGPVAGILVLFTLFFAFMYAYCIRTLNFQAR